MNKKRSILFFIGAALFLLNAAAQNPIIRDQFTADPTARVFNGKMYLFPSHDIPAPDDFARKDWFCMRDYHVFSSENLTDWTDHGVILSQENVNWVDSKTYSMWAPDCFEKDGKFYFYFPANIKAGSGRGFGIGVAVADKPEGPYTPQPEPIKGVSGIDPVVFMDKDGQAYIYWSQGNIFVAKLKANMLELDSEVKVIAELPKQGLKEGPYVFERNGIYYMTYPHVENKIERLEYAISDNPMGPFKVTGVIMDESPTGCWTNHHSLVEYKGQWYLFYHHNDYSPDFDKNRSARIDSLFFNPDGTIQKVIPTLRGVGVTSAVKKIEIDRFSAKSNTGAEIAFIDTTNIFNGWKSMLSTKNAWISYNTVDFGSKKLRSAEVKASSPAGATVEIRLDKPDGILLAEVAVPKGNSLSMVNAGVKKFQKGVHDLYIVLKDSNPVEIDWISFK